MASPLVQVEQPTFRLPADFNREARTAELVTRFAYAESWRKQYDSKALEWYKLYRGWREKAHIEGRSNLHIPKTYEYLDSIRARIVKSFFSTRPYLEFIPRPFVGATPEIMAENAEKAKVASALVDEQLDRNGIKRKFYDFITSVLIFPAGIMSVGWRVEDRTVRIPIPRLANPIDVVYNGAQPEFVVEYQEISERVWDDNEIQVVDYFDFWPDPRGYDIDSCRFVFQREWLSREQIEQKLAVLEEAGLGRVFPIDWEKVHSVSNIQDGRYERMSAVGLAPETTDGFWSDEKGVRIGLTYEVLHYWEDQRYAMLINRCELAYEGQNPYWKHGKKPYVVASFEPLPNEFYGMSAVEIIQHLQEELNTQRNQRIDNASMVLNRMWKVRRGADIDESELVSRPHGIIYVDQPDDVTEIAFSDVPSSAYIEGNVIERDMENALSVPPVVRGADPTRQETATEVVTKSSSAGIRFDVKIMLFEELGIKRLAMLMDLNNQQFLDQGRVVRLFGEDASMKWVMVEPGDLIGERDYLPSGSNVDPAANKELRRQQLIQLMALAAQNPYIDRYELTKMLIQSFDVRNVERLLLPREVVEQQMAQMALQQMLHEQIVAGRVPERQQNSGRRQPQQPQQPVLYGPTGQPISGGSVL